MRSLQVIAWLFTFFAVNTSFGLEIVKNPCSGVSGAPFKSYKAFSIDSTGGVYKHRMESCKSNPVLSVCYDSVEDFLAEKELIIKNKDGEWVSSCNSLPIETVQMQNCEPHSQVQTQKTCSADWKLRPDERYGEQDPANWAKPLKKVSAKDYYGSLLNKLKTEDLNSEEIKNALHQVLSRTHLQSQDEPDKLVSDCPAQVDAGEKCVGHKAFSYRTARRFLMGRAEFYLREKAGKYFVHDVYCQKDYGEKDIKSGQKLPGPMKIPDGQIVNMEHTWPQSRFNMSLGPHMKQTQKADLHHLFPTDSRLNQIRSNYEFGEVETDMGGDLRGLKKYANCHESKMGLISKNSGAWSRDVSTVSFFEPPDIHKGNVARALFYFSVRYDLPISKTEEFFLKKWNKEDPADAEEKSMNELKYEIQGNRNPFIDYADLTDKISDF